MRFIIVTFTIGTLLIGGIAMAGAHAVAEAVTKSPTYEITR